MILPSDGEIARKLSEFAVDTPMTKVRGFSGYAQPTDSRYRLKVLPEPIKKFLYFSGLDFTQKPSFCNHQSKLLKSCDRQTLRLFSCLRLASIHIVSKIIPLLKGEGKSYKTSADSSPAAWQQLRKEMKGE